MNGRMRGFSLPETMLALLLLAIVSSGLANWQRVLAHGLRVQSQTLREWRILEQQSDIAPVQQMPQQITRSETSQGGCVSISVTLTGPQDHRGQLNRLHCPRH